MKVRHKIIALLASTAAAGAALLLDASTASAAATSTVTGSTGCYPESTEYAWVKGDLDNSHPRAQKVTPPWWPGGKMTYKITFSGITNPGWAYIWVECNLAPDHGGWVRTYPGRTVTRDF
jgi:hypothetical protein